MDKETFKEVYSAESNNQIDTVTIELNKLDKLEPIYGRECLICGEFYAGNYIGATFICPICIKRLKRILYPEKQG